MIALCAILAATLAGSLGLTAWLVVTRVRAADQSADARVAQVATEGELERSQFELEQTKQALAQSEKREEILDAAIAEALNANAAGGAALRPDDVLGRQRLLLAEWSRTSKAGREVPAVGERPVPADAPAAKADALMRPGE